MDTNTQTNGNGISRFDVAPKYQRVADDILARIQSGEFKPGAQLANEGDLARAIGVSSGTMRKALDLLEADGLLSRKQGRGTFVREQVEWEDLPPSVKALLKALRVTRPHEGNAAVFTSSGTTYTAGDLRAFAEGAVELVAWLDRRAHLQARAAA